MVCCKDSGDKKGSSLLKYNIHESELGQKVEEAILEPLPALHLDNLTAGDGEDFRGPIDETCTSASQSLAPRHSIFRLGSHSIIDALEFLLGDDKVDMCCY